jgi:REJ domain
MAASSWTDQDLPLQHAFGYCSATGVVVMQPMSQTAFTSAPLPAGQDTNGFNITCQAQVFDSYIAYSRSTCTVTVTKAALKSSALFSLGDNLCTRRFFDQPVSPSFPTILICLPSAYAYHTVSHQLVSYLSAWRHICAWCLFIDPWNSDIFFEFCGVHPRSCICVHCIEQRSMCEDRQHL